MQRSDDVKEPAVISAPQPKQGAVEHTRARPEEADPVRVLVLARDRSAGRSYVRAMERATLSARG